MDKSDRRVLILNYVGIIRNKLATKARSLNGFYSLFGREEGGEGRGGGGGGEESITRGQLIANGPQFSPYHPCDYSLSVTPEL